MRIERAHLVTALVEAEEAVEELERAGARSAAAAWWQNCQTLARMLHTPEAFPEEDPLA